MCARIVVGMSRSSAIRLLGTSSRPVINKSGIQAPHVATIGESGGLLQWHIRDWVDAHGDVGEPEEQAKSLGYLVAALSVANAFDLHFENFIITGRTVIPLDLECLLYPFDSVVQALDPEYLGMFTTRYSGTALLGQTSFTFWSDPNVQDGKVVMQTRSVRREHVLYRNPASPESLIDHLESFRSGFGEGVADAPALVEHIGTVIARGPFLTRKLFRPTKFYRVLQSELMLHDPNMWRGILASRLRFAGHPCLHAYLSIENNEAYELSRLGTPIFHVEVSSGRLYSNLKETRQAFSPPPLDVWKKKTSYLSPAALVRLRDRIENLVRNCAATHGRSSTLS